MQQVRVYRQLDSMQSFSLVQPNKIHAQLATRHRDHPKSYVCDLFILHDDIKH